MAKRTEVGSVKLFLLRRLWSWVLGGLVALLVFGASYTIGELAQAPADHLLWYHPAKLLYYGLYALPFVLAALVAMVSKRLWRSQGFVKRRSWDDISDAVDALNANVGPGDTRFVIEGLADRSISLAHATAAYDAEFERRTEAAWQSLSFAVDFLNKDLAPGEPPFVIEGMADRSIPYATAYAIYYAEVARLQDRK